MARRIPIRKQNRIYELFDQKIPKREIARRLHIHIRTVNSYLKMRELDLDSTGQVLDLEAQAMGYKSQSEMMRRDYTPQEWTEHLNELARNRGFESHSAYAQEMVRRRGFKSYYDYQNHLARKEGYRNASQKKKVERQRRQETMAS